MFFLRIFFLKPTERTSVLLKNGARSFRNCSLLERSACFYETIAGNFERFDFKFKTKFLKLQILFKNWCAVFYLKVLRLKTQQFHTKLLCQKPMLTQIEWEVQSGPITKNGFLPVSTIFFQKFCFSLRTTYKVLIWFTRHPNVHIHTFWKRWSFIWVCFFPVSILKTTFQ